MGFLRAPLAGMAYRFTDISVESIYLHFLEYRLSVSVKVRTDGLSYTLSIVLIQNPWTPPPLQGPIVWVDVTQIRQEKLHSTSLISL